MVTALQIALVILTIVLLVLLISRIRREARFALLMGGGGLIPSNEMAELFAPNSSREQVVARVSKLLRENLACRRILFLGKSGSDFNLDYQYGGEKIKALRLEFDQRMQDYLIRHGAPEAISNHSLTSVCQLKDIFDLDGTDLCFPVLWRGELGGIFLVGRGSLPAPLYNLLLTTLAQTLTGADHATRMSFQGTFLDGYLSSKASARSARHRVLNLVSHRDSELLVGEFIGEVQNDLDLEGMAFLYEPTKPEAPLQLVRKGLTANLEVPHRGVLPQILARLGSGGARPISDLHGPEKKPVAWGEDLEKAGLKHIAAVPLSDQRVGVVAWTDSRSPSEVLARLRRHTLAYAPLLENAESFERMEEMSLTDNLTGLANQRHFQKRLAEEIGRAERYRRSVALIIFDLDELKSINDRYGHQAGDAVLRQMGEVIRESIRSIDFLARLGGDEFCIIMPESDSPTCLRFMSRLQEKTASQPLKIDGYNFKLHCTISQGGAVFPDHADGAEKLIFAADMALLRAKEAGRNRHILL